jgi:predicted alpha/beta hydrolase family esterase
MKNKKQIIYIHGGQVFKKKEHFYNYLRKTEVNTLSKSKTWADFLEKDLKNYEIIKPNMPCKFGSDYKGWEIWFQRHFGFLNDEVILIGWSLGGSFLLKYLTENKFTKKIKQLHLIAPGVIRADLLDFKVNIKKVNKLKSICEKIYLWHSKDDDIVSFKDSQFLKKKLPEIELFSFKDRGHFYQKNFPEILSVIKKLK